jgi:hypothetical protein
MIAGEGSLVGGRRADGAALAERPLAPALAAWLAIASRDFR